MRKHGFGLVALALLACLSSASAQGGARTIHVFVALADNQNQGIVPVPAKLGNGEDPNNNLYWGSAYGVRTFFSRSAEWQLTSTRASPKPEILERCVFKHQSRNVYLVADAYRGSQIKQAIVDFLDATTGANAERILVKAGAQTISIDAGGSASLIAYVGHDGLMDFQLSALPQKRQGVSREAIVLACFSKAYFERPLSSAGAYPLLWTNGLMAPEAYTLKSAIDGWILKESNQQIRERAAHAYNKYQNCGLGAARKLLTTGW